MSAPASTSRRRTFCPCGPVWGVTSCMPRICFAFSRTSSSDFATFTPPPLPRPPAWICALTTHRVPPSCFAASTASSTLKHGTQRVVAIPNLRNSSLPWYSWIFMRAFLRPGGAHFITRSAASAARGKSYNRAMQYILALDQGTTSSRAIIFDEGGAARSLAQREFRQIFPQPGWVEHDPQEIWVSQRDVARAAIEQADIEPEQIRAIGITNQRETTVLWDRQTGEPLYNAIVWQDRRTAAQCAELRASGAEETVRAKTGLVFDPYFSGTKLAWLLDNIPGARIRAERGELAFGTIDTWIAWN